MKKILFILLLLPAISFGEIRVSTVQELIAALGTKKACHLMNDIDVTDIVLPAVSDTLFGHGFKLISRKLPSIMFLERFIVTINGGLLDSVIIFGPNGSVMADGGYAGGVQSLEKGGTIRNCTILNCDKFGIYNKGARNTVKDTLKIVNCVIIGCKRNGYGYGIWTQYGLTRVYGSYFDQCRHFIDGSTESNQYDIQNNYFGESVYNFSIHLHIYPDKSNRSGNGFIFRGNYVFDKTNPVQIFRSFTGETKFEGNYFLAETIGSLSGEPIEQSEIWGHNEIGGRGMLPAPTITAPDTVRVGTPFTLSVSGYKKYSFLYGEVPENSHNYPNVHIYGAYGIDGGSRSIAAYKTVFVVDTGIYTGFNYKTFHSVIEVYRDGIFVERLTSFGWSKYLIRGGKITFKIIGEEGAECYIDDWVKNGTYETFEVTNKIKPSGFTGKMSTGRFAGESSSGVYCFHFGFREAGSAGLE